MLQADLEPEQVESLLAVVAAINMYDLDIVVDMTKAAYPDSPEDVEKAIAMVMYLEEQPDKGKKLARVLKQKYPDVCNAFVEHLDNLAERAWWDKQMRRM
jgi:hypothetical protein